MTVLLMIVGLVVGWKLEQAYRKYNPKVRTWVIEKRLKRG